MLFGRLAPVVGNAAESTDDYFENVSLLLQGDGTNGAQNNTFVDGSPNNFSITRNGNTTQGSFSPYGSNWSNYTVSSTNSRLSGNAAIIDSSTSTFTVEAFVYMTQTPTGDTSHAVLFGLDCEAYTNINYLTFGVKTSQQVAIYWYAGGARSCVGSTTIPLNTWTHIAVVVNSNTISLYVNGVAETLSGTTTLTNRSGSSNASIIGANYYTTFYGYWSNLRVSNIARTITVPTVPYTADANTLVLQGGSNNFTSTGTLSVTWSAGSSGPSVERFSPFSPTSAYSTSTIGGSGYFDGSGDYLTLPDNTAFDFPGDFTIEAWVYLKTVSGDQGVYTSIDNGSDSWVGITLLFSGTSFLATSYISGNDTITHQNAVTANQWYHIAIVRNGSSTKSYLNGVQSTGTTTGTYSLTQSGGTVGSAYPGASPLNGYISNLRVVKGTAVYTSSFTPTTTPLTAISGTSLLLNYTNAGIYDNAMMNDFETVGNVQVSTSVKKYGTGSMYFDGSGDYLKFKPGPNNLFSFGTGDFTIEMWIYLNSGSNNTLFDIYDDNSIGRMLLQITSSRTLQIAGDSGVNRTSTTSTVPLSTWTHIAFCRASGVTKLFIDGVQGNTNYSDTNNYTCTTGVLYFGINGYDASSSPLSAYIDDLRITKGYARYTSNFTPATAALPKK